MNIAVILAGGVGNRVGAGIPKQFIEILGKPVLAYTIEPFNRHPDVDAILVVCVKPYVDYIWKLKEQYGFDKLVWVTEGGATFQESVMNGMNFLRDKADRNDTVLFHFGASPFVTDDVIADVIRVCKEVGTNAISSTDYYLLSGEKKSTDTVLASGNYTEKYIDRDTIAVMNSPHAFQYGFLVDMYREAVETGVIETVEPHTTTLMYALGKRIYFSKGSQTNIKITTKDDLKLFEGFVLQQQRNSRTEASGDVIVFLADGFEECEGLLVVDLLRRAGLKTVMASVMGRRDVKSSRGILIQTDCLAENADYEKARMIVLPGGRLGTENLGKSDLVREKCLEFAGGKMVAAVCAAPSLLASFGILDGRKATVHPDFRDRMAGAAVFDESVVADGNVITGQGLGATIPFAFEIISSLAGSDTAERIKKAICYRE
jgi:2-C-methyl-D-erythritol 4-phosphate cytidylyltransferase